MQKKSNADWGLRLRLHISNAGVLTAEAVRDGLTCSHIVALIAMMLNTKREKNIGNQKSLKQIE